MSTKLPNQPPKNIPSLISFYDFFIKDRERYLILLKYALEANKINDIPQAIPGFKNLIKRCKYNITRAKNLKKKYEAQINSAPRVTKN